MHTLVSRLAAVRVHVLAVHQVQEPAQLVELSVVGGVSSMHREVHRPAGHPTPIDSVRLCDHRRGRLQAQRFLWPEGIRGHRGTTSLHPLATQRRLLVDNPKV